MAIFLCVEGIRRYPMRKKVYLHYENGNTEPYSTSVWVEKDSLVIDILQKFSQNIRSEASKQILTHQADLTRSNGEVLDDQCSLYDVIDNKEDMFVIDTSRKKCPDAASTLKTTSATATGASRKTENKEVSQSSISDMVTKLQQNVSKKKFKRARELCEEILRMSPNNYNATALEFLAHISFASKQYDKAVVCAEKVLQNDSPGLRSRHLGVFLVLAQAHRENGDFQDAVERIVDCLQILEKGNAGMPSTEDAHTLELDLNAELTRCLFLMGRHGDAGNRINAVMTDPSYPARGLDTQGHVGCLLAYAEIAFQYDKIPEALQAALKAVVASSTDKRAQKLIADILSHPGGIDELYRQAPPNEKAPTAYAFLAMACKDHSALTTSATLLREAIRIQRRKGRVADGNIHNHVLNLAHVLEANGEFGAALQLMGEHLQLVANTPGATSGLVTADDYGGIINVLLEDGSLPAAWSNPQRKQISIWFPPVLDTSLRVVWHPTSAGTGTNEGYATVESLDGASSEDAQRGTLDLSKDLDLLAITFTIVKILFVQGNLEAIPSLVRAIELIRRRAKTPLHSTNIRNEHAYYMCICQVLSAMQDPLTPLRYSPFSTAIMDAKPLYVVGDSHSLSSAWTVISFGGENRIIVPKLVTGLKQYHLRSESDFYTKESFNKTIASIPAGAEVIFLVGEIDCREGLLVAVERDVYQSVEEGMEATVAIFKGVLTALIKKKKFKAYIHPILPVLDVTRSIVTTFNMQYERSVAGLQGCTWLDFYSSMLSNDGQHLKEEWQLDGTHVHPSYVALIERCLNQGLEGS